MAKINPEEIAREIFDRFNPEGLVPFPFTKVLETETDLEIRPTPLEDDSTSGAILYSIKDKKFVIVVNTNKPKTRQYFTTAHELGHYFLHRESITTSGGFIDPDITLDSSAILFRKDDLPNTEVEREANQFAAVLLMPEELVKEAWLKLQNVDKCAEVFDVSILAMSIRLEKLGITRN